MSVNDSEAKIINYLFENKEKEAWGMEITRVLDMPKRTVYRNLESLEEKKIVEVERKGNMIFYTLAPKWVKVIELLKNDIFI